MVRGKSVVKLLLDSSQEALFAGVEIHNKPHVSFRYPTASILIINAWELALKAYVYKYVGRKKIYEKDGVHTIGITRALKQVTDSINSIEGKNKFKAVSENITLLNEYRNSNIHYSDSKLDPVIFMLMSKAVLNYDYFVKKYFNRDITKEDNLIILPIGFKLPFDPIDYLIQDYGNAHNEYVNNVIETIRNLNDDGVSESIVIGFDVYADRVKNPQNADIIAAIERSPKAVALHRTVRYTDDSEAPAMRIEQDIPPLTYTELVKLVKEKRPDIKVNTDFHTAMKHIKIKPSLCVSRYLDPKRKTGGKKDFFYPAAVDEFIVAWETLHNNK